MTLIELTSLDHPGIEIFSTLTETQLRNRLEPDKGIFIAESPKVIDIALNNGYEPLALLCERPHIEGDAASIIARCGDIPIYTGSRELLSQLTGYTLTRGVLCAMHRPKPKSVEEVCQEARRIAVIDNVVNATNTGAIFRAAAALGIDAILCTPTASDPWNRRSVRVSMGTVFMVPWTWINAPLHSLHTLGFSTIALALDDRAIPIDSPELKQLNKIAIVLGTEGEGLPKQTIESSDYVVTIPMQRGVDSLNVAAAASVAFWELGR